MKYKKYIIKATSVIPEIAEKKNIVKDVPEPTTQVPAHQHVISLLTDSEGEVSEDSQTDVEAEVDELFNSDDGEPDSEWVFSLVIVVGR